MTETGPPIPQEIALEEVLKETGIPLHRGGLRWDPIFRHDIKVPVVALWHQSETPSEGEVKLLVEIANDIISMYYPAAVDGYFVEGHNMITLNKQDGLWTFRRMTWSVGPTWSVKRLPLDELRQSGLL